MANASSTIHLNLPAKLVTEIFNKVSGHSSLAKLCKSEPIPFSGAAYMTFSMGQEAELVGEGSPKAAGDAEFKPVTVKPVKVQFTHRVSDEFINASEEARLPTLQTFGEAFTRVAARALDIIAMHGVNPRTKLSAASVADKCFDALVTNSVDFDAAQADACLDDATQLVCDNRITGMAMAPAFASAMSKIKANGTPLYPEFRFGGRPDSFAGLTCDVNSTVAFGTDITDYVIGGNFEHAFKWGYAKEIPIEVIPYGDPDGLGDLKRNNQVALRGEAYIGFGILDPSAFFRVVPAETTGSEGDTTEPTS